MGEVALRRDQLDEEIKADIESEAAGWGVDIISVKVRDIVIPAELQNIMSLGGPGRPRTQCPHDGGQCRGRLWRRCFLRLLASTAMRMRR